MKLEGKESITLLDVINEYATIKNRYTKHEARITPEGIPQLADDLEFLMMLGDGFISIANKIGMDMTTEFLLNENK